MSKAKELSAARKAYVAVLKAEPSSACAAAGLAKLNTAAPASASEDCTLGDAYQSVHRNDDAITAFKAGLGKDPSAACARDGLTAAGPTSATRTVNDVVGSIPNVLVALGLALLAFFLFLLFGYWPWMKRQMQRPWIVGPVISRVLAPRLTFDAIADDAVDGKPGGPITARIKERLGRMRDEALSKNARPYDLDLATPREEFADLVSTSSGLKNSLDNASDISDQTKIVAALLNLAYSLLPIRRFEISGTLEPPGSSGAAATLLLESNAKLAAATTLRAPWSSTGSPTAPDYVQLADPAAVWIQYEVARALEHKDPNPTTAESQALVREGLDYFARDELDQARACYEKAIRLNRRNWAAYVCLAVAEARLAENFDQSIKRTEEGIEAMRTDANA